MSLVQVAKLTKDYARLRFIKDALREQTQVAFQLGTMARALGEAEEAEDYERYTNKQNQKLRANMHAKDR